MAYDAAGNVTSDGKFRYQTYTYDANNRLRETRRADAVSTTSAVYDGVGQRVQTSIEGTESHDYVYDAMGRVIAEYGSDGWTRDRIYRGGEMIASDEAIGRCLKTIEQFVNAFYWGAFGRFPTAEERQSESAQLRSAQGQGQAQMVAEAQRFGREMFHSAEYAARNRTDEQFVHDMYYAWQQRPADEEGYHEWVRTISGSGREHVIDGFADGGEFAGRVGALCAGTATEAVLWQFTDQVGSVRMVVNESGAVQDRHDTAPFGDEINWGAVRATNNTAQAGQTSAADTVTSTGLYGWNETIRARYAGLERDTPTGLEHTQWRKYDGWQGRWTTTDPSLASMSVGDPQSLNRYSYVQNDPINMVDPTGLESDPYFGLGPPPAAADPWAGAPVIARIETFAPRWIPDFDLLNSYSSYRTYWTVREYDDVHPRERPQKPQPPAPPNSAPRNQNRQPPRSDINNCIHNASAAANEQAGRIRMENTPNILPSGGSITSALIFGVGGAVARNALSGAIRGTGAGLGGTLVGAGVGAIISFAKDSVGDFIYKGIRENVQMNSLGMSLSRNIEDCFRKNGQEPPPTLRLDPFGFAAGGYQKDCVNGNNQFTLFRERRG